MRNRISPAFAAAPPALRYGSALPSAHSSYLSLLAATPPSIHVQARRRIALFWQPRRLHQERVMARRRMPKGALPLSYGPVNQMEPPGLEPGTDVLPAAFAPRGAATKSKKQLCSWRQVIRHGCFCRQEGSNLQTHLRESAYVVPSAFATVAMRSNCPALAATRD